MHTLRLADLTIAWSSTDATTPAGHVLVSGVDPTGLHSLCLYASDTPNEHAYRGHLLVPPDNHNQRFLPARTTAYDPGGAYVTSVGDRTALLARLAGRATEK